MDLFSEIGYAIARIRIKESDNNYNYIAWCTETLECAVIDPLDAKTILNFTRDKSLTVKYVINTHTHPDHVGGNDNMCRATGAKILVHPWGQELVSLKSEAIQEGDFIDMGKQKIEVIHTPGHCPEHVSLVLGESVFVGDTLFLAGCGNTRYRGNVDELYESIAFKLRPLSDDSKIFCGHDYSQTNMRFALSIEPENRSAGAKLDEVKAAHSQGKEPSSTVGEERGYNPFFRFDVPEVITEMKKRKPGLGYSPREIFKELRELRNNWK